MNVLNQQIIVGVCIRHHTLPSCKRSYLLCWHVPHSQCSLDTVMSKCWPTEHPWYILPPLLGWVLHHKASPPSSWVSKKKKRYLSEKVNWACTNAWILHSLPSPNVQGLPIWAITAYQLLYQNNQWLNTGGDIEVNSHCLPHSHYLFPYRVPPYQC